MISQKYINELVNYVLIIKLTRGYNFNTNIVKR